MKSYTETGTRSIVWNIKMHLMRNFKNFPSESRTKKNIKSASFFPKGFTLRPHTLSKRHLPHSVLCQFLGFVVQGIHNFAHIVYSFKSCFISLIYWRFVKNDQDSLTLIKDTMKLFVQDHLR